MSGPTIIEVQSSIVKVIPKIPAEYIVQVTSDSPGVEIENQEVIVQVVQIVDSILVEPQTAAEIVIEDVAYELSANIGFVGQTVVVSAVAKQDILAGQPIYADRTTGKFGLADSTTQQTSTNVGLAIGAALTGFVVSVDTTLHIQDDWTDVIGSALLAEGQTYYLTPTPGILGTTPPSAAGQFVAPVGVAVNTTTMRLSSNLTILL